MSWITMLLSLPVRGKMQKTRTHIGESEERSDSLGRAHLSG